MSPSQASSPSHRLQISYNPWIYTFLFVVSNILLSYFHFSLSIKLWIGIFGLGLPFFLALWTLHENGKLFNTPGMGGKSLSKTNSSNENPPLWLWGLFIFLLLAIRFYKLTSLIKAFLTGALHAERTRELTEIMKAAGVPV